MYCTLEDFLTLLNNPQICPQRSTEDWILHWFGRHVVRPGTVPNLGMVDWEFELLAGSDMGSSDLQFGLETGPVTGLADPELAYYPFLGLDPNWFNKPRVRSKDWT